MSTKTCNECGRPAIARGLCAGHYSQARRGEPLRPLRGAHGQRGNAPAIVLPGVAVSPECVAALDAAGPSRYEAARAVLEQWAKERGEQ